MIYNDDDTTTTTATTSSKTTTNNSNHNNNKCDNYIEGKIVLVIMTIIFMVILWQ